MKSLVVLAALALPLPLAAQRLSIPAAALADSAARPAALARLAAQAAAVYTDSNQAVQQDNLFRLHLLARRYTDAAVAMANWRRAWAMHGDTTARGRAVNVQYEIYLRAKRLQGDSAGVFPDAFARAFRERFTRLDDRTAALVARTFLVPPLPPPAPPSADTTMAVGDAVAWLRGMQIAETYAELGRLAAPLVREDDERRYVKQSEIQVKTPDGATVCAMVWHPRSGPSRVPALLQFTIYADTNPLIGDLRRNASNGYAAVIGFTRGKACSPDAPMPYVHDGTDAVALIDWIARQPWSDGRVGMYGGSYSGMSPWAAAKGAPPALKAIMVGAPVAPGVDVPMEGNIVWNFIYPWPFYTTDTRALDDATYNDQGRWRRLNNTWYTSGRAYQDMDRIDGTPNPIWHDWIAHSSYDGYWRDMIPYGGEFAAIRIPVLQTAGYYFGGPGAALYYLTQHYRHDPRARHYLLIGPYDHFQAQRGVVSALGDTISSIAGYETDPVARIDITADLRYRWFDWILKGGPRPALLADKVNYEVIGANRWKHAPSVAAMSNGALRLYLSDERAGAWHRLVSAAPSRDTSLTLTMDLADRSDSNRIVPGGGVSDTAIDTLNTLVFASDPLPEATEISGLPSGHLELVANKRDFDFGISIFELRKDGTYRSLPPYQSRASYVADISRRQLLTPGKRASLDWKNVRLVSQLCEAGSRVVMVIGPIRNPGQQINYGTGKDVNAETVADAGEPLTIRWSNRSYLDLPVWRASPGVR
ncbi:MAG: CocE/NonD family hydrolase [Gemmatimonadales bacterium]